MIFLPRYSHSSSRVFTEFGVVIARGIFVAILILRGFTESASLPGSFRVSFLVIFSFAIKGPSVERRVSRERKTTHTRHSSVLHRRRPRNRVVRSWTFRRKAHGPFPPDGSDRETTLRRREGGPFARQSSSDVIEVTLSAKAAIRFAFPPAFECLRENSVNRPSVYIGPWSNRVRYRMRDASSNSDSNWWYPDAT